MSILKKLFSAPVHVHLDAAPPQPTTDTVLRATVDQLKFLLAVAPTIDAPNPRDARSVFLGSRSPFAYIHPKTMAQYGTALDKVPHGVVVKPGSPTRWVLLSLVPEGRVIYSSLAIPGLEKILAQ